MRDFLIPLGTVLAAVIVSTFTMRTSRKTPHERLTALVEIAKDMPPHLDTEAVVQRAIIRELADLDSSLEASKGSWLDELKDWLGAHFPVALLTVSLPLLLLSGGAIRLTVGPLDLDGWPRIAVAIAWSTLITVPSAYAALRLRASHNRRRAAFIRELEWKLSQDVRVERAFRKKPDDQH